jgi:hypothetical protein
MPHELNTPEIFALLAKRQRRLLLQLLQESSTPVTLTELANRIGNEEYDTPSAEDLRSIQLRLHHVHLPKLENADVVAYNEETRTVHVARNFRPLIRFLENIPQENLPWSDA